MLLLFSQLTFSQQLATFDELVPLYPDTEVKEDKLTFSSHSLKGGKAVLHVLMKRLKSNGQVSVKLSSDEIEAAKLLPVSVSQNTGLNTRTELIDGKYNPHVIRRAPFQIYDAIKPIREGTTLSDANGSLALRFEINIPENTTSHEQVYKIELKNGRWSRTVKWNIKIEDKVLPKQNLSYTNWFSLSNFASYHQCELWSDAHWEKITQAAKIMRHEGQNMFLVPWGAFMKIDTKSKVILDEKKLDRFAKIFLDIGFDKVELGHLATRENGEWGAKHLVTQLGKVRVDSAKGRDILKQQLAHIRAFVKRHKLDEKVYQHISDEPLSAHAKDYVEVAKIVHENLPEAPVFDATHCTTELVGSVDVWCPQLDIYYKNREFFQQRIKEGEEVWIYTCLSPGGRALNRLLDQEKTRMVLLKWLIVKDGLSGYLHWGLNHYQKKSDPYLVTSPRFDNNTGPSRNFLPPGDSHVVYPDKENHNVLSSVRLSSHRLGLEDAAMLTELKKKSPETAQSIFTQLLKSPREHELGISHYRKVRTVLLQFKLK